jgi:hypothetical protein
MVFKSLLSLFWQGIKPSPWIHIVHIKPGLLDTLVKPLYWGYGDMGKQGLLLHWGDYDILYIPADFWYD